MAKKQQTPFRLSVVANRQLKSYLAAIRKGIENVCELHRHDSNPSMKQVEFEKLYIDKILGQPITAISASLRAMMEGLTAQKEAEAESIKQNNIKPTEALEDK